MKHITDLSYYIIQDSCENCQHACIISEIDSEADIYCNKDRSERPLSGSVLMDESHFMLDGTKINRLHPQYRINSDAWDKWSENRKVNRRGMCHDWEGM